MNVQKIALLLIVVFINGCTSTTGNKANGDNVSGGNAGRDNINAGRDVTINSPKEEQLPSISDKGVIKSSVVNGSVFINGANVSIDGTGSDYKKNIPTILTIYNIPIIKYKEGAIKIKEIPQITGFIEFVGEQRKKYDLNGKYNDLTIRLESNPIQKGESVKGNLNGKVFDGTKTQEVSIDFVLPIN